MPRPRLLPVLLPLAAILLVLAAAGAGPRPKRAPRTRVAAASAVAPEPRAVELVESVPLEAALGNPKLRHAPDVWLELVHGATKSIDLEQFYVSNWPDEPLDPVIQALVGAAKRGVRVRILVDARMHRTYPQPVDSLGLVPGITVRTIDMGKVAGGVQHSKYWLVDGATTFLGSQNFDWRALEHIHEMGVCIRDERVTARFQQVFEMDWAVGELQAAGADTSRIIAWPEPPPLTGTLPIRIVQAAGDTVDVWPSWNPARFSPDSTLWDRDAIVRVVDGARSEVVLQALGYATADRGLRDDALDQALRRAAARGVRVELIVSDWQAGSDKMRSVDSLAMVPGVEVRMSKVPEWSKAYIPFGRVEHCKYVVADTAVTWVGTSNFEPSYFHTTRNIAVTLRNAPLAREARDSFRASWDAAAGQPVHPGATYAPRVHGDTPPEGRTKYGR